MHNYNTPRQPVTHVRSLYPFCPAVNQLVGNVIVANSLPFRHQVFLWVSVSLLNHTSQTAGTASASGSFPLPGPRANIDLSYPINLGCCYYYAWFTLHLCFGTEKEKLWLSFYPLQMSLAHPAWGRGLVLSKTAKAYLKDKTPHSPRILPEIFCLL